MNNQAILTKAIEIAIGNGYVMELSHWQVRDDCYVYAMYYDRDIRDWQYSDEQEPLLLFDVIYSHDFAKALWSDVDLAPMPNGTCLYEYRDDTQMHYKFLIPAWKHHLQQMVVASDPIEYLGKNLPIET